MFGMFAHSVLEPAKEGGLAVWIPLPTSRGGVRTPYHNGRGGGRDPPHLPEYRRVSHKRGPGAGKVHQSRAGIHASGSPSSGPPLGPPGLRRMVDSGQGRGTSKRWILGTGFAASCGRPNRGGDGRRGAPNRASPAADSCCHPDPGPAVRQWSRRRRRGRRRADSPSRAAAGGRAGIPTRGGRRLHGPRLQR